MALLTLPDLTTLIEPMIELYKAKVLSTPSPNEIFLTVNDEFIQGNIANPNENKAQIDNKEVAEKIKKEELKTKKK